MPSLRKLSEAEIAALEQPAPDPRDQVAREYDTYLASFAIGDDGQVDLGDERRDVVRARLHAAACRRGLALRFRPGPGPALIFQVGEHAKVGGSASCAVRLTSSWLCVGRIGAAPLPAIGCLLRARVFVVGVA